MTSLTVSDREMPGNHKWVQLNIGILTSTEIAHALPPNEAIKVAEAMIAKAKELQEHNQRVEDEKWENRGGYPNMELDRDE